ncbi:MAG: DNA/RNA non-specific endonuclease [Gallionellaceae bacterium]|jgi:endonuclease G
MIALKTYLNRFALIAALSISATAQATNTDFNQCPQFFANNTSPVIQKPEGLKLRALCYSEFAVMHSGKSRTPVYVVEKLNRQNLQNAHKKRTDQFFADARLPRSERAELEDYKGSGFDRGHMAPAADMSTLEGMAQCFSLANMIPQNSINNRKSWAGIEKATRKYVMRAAGDVYVISGPVFDATPATIGSNQVWVPRYIYKLVYDPSTKKAWAHWIENTDTAKAGKPISYQELVQRTGINFLPNFK